MHLSRLCLLLILYLSIFSSPQNLDIFANQVDKTYCVPSSRDTIKQSNMTLFVDRRHVREADVPHKGLCGLHELNKSPLTLIALLCSYGKEHPDLTGNERWSYMAKRVTSNNGSIDRKGWVDALEDCTYYIYHDCFVLFLIYNNILQPFLMMLHEQFKLSQIFLEPYSFYGKGIMMDVGSRLLPCTSIYHYDHHRERSSPAAGSFPSFLELQNIVELSELKSQNKQL